MVKHTKNLHNWIVPIMGLVVVGGLLSGCSSNSQMSDKDLADIKKGPPKEMPAEAIKVMQQGGRNHGAPATK